MEQLPLFPDTAPEGAVFRVYRARRKGKTDRAGNPVLQVVFAPNKPMLAFQRSMLRRLRIQVGGQSSRYASISCVSGLDLERRLFLPISRKRYVAKLDLFFAYGSVVPDRMVQVVASRLRDPSCAPEWESFLRNHCLHPKLGLRCGAPASPDLFDIYCDEILDKAICRAFPFPQKVSYWRYADDLIFASDTPLCLSPVREILARAGFLENHRKTKIVDRTKGQIVILGRTLAQISPYYYRWEGITKRIERRIVDGRPRSKKDAMRLTAFDDGRPARSIGLSREEVAKLEREVYRAWSGALVESPSSLAGKVGWFVQSVLAAGLGSFQRALNCREKKLVARFREWAARTGQVDPTRKLG